MWYVWPSTVFLLNYITLLLKQNMVTSPEVQGDLKCMLFFEAYGQSNKNLLDLTAMLTS